MAYTRRRSHRHIRAALLACSFILLLFVPETGSPQFSDQARFEKAKKEFTTGLSYFNRMKYLAAVEFFRKAVEIYPDYNTARDYLARSYKLAGFVDSALKEWESLRDADPENVAIQGKIENLRFRETEPAGDDILSSLVLQTTYASRTMRRFSFPYPADLAVDDEKFLYVTSFSTGKLVRIDPNGNGTDVLKTGVSPKLYGIDYRGGRFVVSDFGGDRVHVIDRKGTILLTIGGSGSEPGRFHGPQGVCFDERGKIYVVDSGNHRVQKFSGRGEFILQFGKRGDYEGELENPSDAVAFEGKVYVSDTGNKRIASFDDSGNFVGNIGGLNLSMPRGISRSGDMLLLSDEKQGLLLYRPADGYSRWFNSWGDGESFSRLNNAVTDRDGYLYCLDYNREAVSVFTPEQKRYSNLEVEITSVDTQMFPVVAFYLNVRNRDGSPLYGLDQENFKLTEDGSLIDRLDLSYLKRVAPSVSVALCVDRSTGMAGYHNEIPWVAEFIYKSMRVNDAVKIFNFNDRVWAGSQFDWSRRRGLAAIRQNEYGAGKQIGGALYNAIGDLSERVNRRAVVVVTDGALAEGDFGRFSLRDVINYARVQYIPVYVVSFKEPHPDLERLAKSTGGALYRPTQVDSLRSLYQRIKAADEYRYVAAYRSYKLPAFKGWWSSVKIEIDYKSQKGIEWGGYFVPER